MEERRHNSEDYKGDKHIKNRVCDKVKRFKPGGI